MRNKRNEIVYYTDNISKQYDRLYIHLGKAKSIYDKIKGEYLIGLDFDKTSAAAQNIIEEFIKAPGVNEGREWHRFASVMTNEGQVCLYNNLTKGIANRIIAKGKPGNGKSTMFKKIGKAATEAGYNVEYYHCSLDPNKIDMIVIKELSFAILDGNEPHPLDPVGNDRIIDMYKYVNNNVIQENDELISELEVQYKTEMSQVINTYNSINSLYLQLKKYYLDAMDFNDVDALRKRITSTIKAMKG